MPQLQFKHLAGQFHCENDAPVVDQQDISDSSSAIKSTLHRPPSDEVAGQKVQNCPSLVFLLCGTKLTNVRTQELCSFAFVKYKIIFISCCCT